MNPDKQRLNDTLTTLDGAYAPATLRAYREDVEALIDFCIKLNAKAFPVNPETLAAFIAKKHNPALNLLRSDAQWPPLGPFIVSIGSKIPVKILSSRLPCVKCIAL
jgi:hypothetical protein